ncbi:uncharacterized protein LOC144552065 [Carex rostrata]
MPTRRSDFDWNPWNHFNGSTRTPRLPTGDVSHVYSSIIWFGRIRVDVSHIQSSTIFIGSMTVDLSRIELLPVTIGSDPSATAVRRQVQSRAPGPIFARNLVIGPPDLALVSVEPSIVPLSIALVQNSSAVNPSDSNFSFFSQQIPASGSALAPPSLPQTPYTSHLNQSRGNHSPLGSNPSPR